MSVKRLVIYSSVALKWRLRDEEATSQADALLGDFLSGALDLLTPTLFDYEIANALKVALTKGRLNKEEAALALDDFHQYANQRIDLGEIHNLAFQLACQYQRSVYDSAYLALAQSKGLWVYTGDRKLFNATKDLIPWVRWIGDYQLDTIPVATSRTPSPDLPQTE